MTKCEGLAAAAAASATEGQHDGHITKRRPKCLKKFRYPGRQHRGVIAWLKHKKQSESLDWKESQRDKTITTQLAQQAMCFFSAPRLGPQLDYCCDGTWRQMVARFIIARGMRGLALNDRASVFSARHRAVCVP